MMLSFLPEYGINSIICLSVEDIVSKITGETLFGVLGRWNYV